MSVEGDLSVRDDGQNIKEVTLNRYLLLGHRGCLPALNLSNGLVLATSNLRLLGGNPSSLSGGN